MNWLVYDSQEGYASVIKMEKQKNQIKVKNAGSKNGDQGQMMA